LNAFPFHNIITVVFQNERKHEHTRFLFFIYVRRVQKHLLANHISKQNLDAAVIKEFYNFLELLVRSQMKEHTSLQNIRAIIFKKK